MILEYFEELANGLEIKLAEPGLPYVARKRLTLEIARLGVRLFSGKERIAWCGVLTPFDLLSAMGVRSAFAEFTGALLASTGTVETFLGLAEDDGYSTDSCSYHRAVIGAASQNLMPEPQFLIATTAPCTGGLALVEELARRFDKDLFVLHVPNDDRPDGVDYLAEQIRTMVDFVSAHTGEPLDGERLAAAMRKTNEARALLKETYALAGAVPSPARRRDMVNLNIVMSLLLGEDAAVEVARTYRDELRRKIEQHDTGVEGEQLRLLWLQNRIQFKTSLDAMLEREHHTAIVADEINDINWDPIDPEDPYRGLAARMMSVCYVGPVSRRLDNLKRIARDYHIDGALNPCHWGCRQGAGSRGLVAAGLKEAGIPVLNLEVDCVDPRNFSEGQLRTRLEAFVEMLLAERQQSA
ncbi:2-hydroxyacyl-CoA dehydratase subunit D [Myxococcota bacterium]